jgi:signal transduction histidine kinase
VATAALAEAASELRRALEEIRRMLAALSPEGSPQEEPLELVVQKVLERWRLPASWSIEGDVEALPGPVLAAASSVIREGVANAAKHSASSEVAVRVEATPQGVEVQVEDRGRGFLPAQGELGDGHLGLEMMRRLVAEVRGTLDIESSPGRGTRVVARLPVDERGDEP